MKISTILSRFLSTNGTLSLKEIGTFYTSLPADADKEQFSDAGGLYFQFEPKAKMNEDVVAFVSQQSGKMKSLAAADLESYLQNGKQLINIGKPFIIEGVGSIIKRQDGTYMITENFFNPLEEETPSSQKQHTDSGAELNYEDYKYASNTKPVSGKKTMIIAGSVVLIALISWMIYKLMSNPTVKENPTPTVTQQVTDSSQRIKDTTAVKDSVIVPAIKDSLRAFYKVVLYDTSKTFALSSFKWFKEHNYPLYLETADSVRYKIYYRYDTPFADSVNVRDSIGRRFHRKVYIE